MLWVVRLSRDARRQVEKLPAGTARLILKRLAEMAADPFLGDVEPLQGKKWKGFYRKRAGGYRIIFSPLRQDGIVDVSATLARSERI